MEVDTIISKIQKLVNNQKIFPYLKEAFSIFSYKSKNGYKFIHYVTSTALLFFGFIIGFIIFGFLNCFSAVNSLTQLNLITIIFYCISIIVVSAVLTPLISGYSLMVYKDIYLNLKSDLSDFLFFIHSFDQRKKDYLIKAYFLTLISTFLITFTSFLYVAIFLNLSKIISKLQILGWIILFALKITVILILFSLVFPFITSIFLIFTKENINLNQSNTSVNFNEILLILKSVIRIYFKEFFRLSMIGFFVGLGFITVIGNLVTLPLGNIMVGIVLRKYS